MGTIELRQKTKEAVTRAYAHELRLHLDVIKSVKYS